MKTLFYDSLWTRRVTESSKPRLIVTIIIHLLNREKAGHRPRAVQEKRDKGEKRRANWGSRSLLGILGMAKALLLQSISAG